MTGLRLIRSPLAAIVTTGLLVAVPIGVALRQRTAADPTLEAVVRRGSLTATLTTSGTLRPIESLTYRSPLAGREAEILELVPEGSLVREGDVLARLDTSDLQRDSDRVSQEVRQLQLELQVAHGERQEAESAVKMVAEGDGALSVDESRTRLQLAQKKVERLRQEHEQLAPLLVKGFITRDELARTSSDLEAAEEELALARKRTSVIVQLTHPRDQQRAALQLAQKHSQLENVVGRTQEAGLRLQQLEALLEASTIRARRPGLVVYEPFMNASPRRKIRVGDRVSASQGLVTIPEVNRMLVETSVSEAEVHRVHAGQPARIRLEAFPELRLTGKVARVGTLASSSIERPMDDKRFDLVIALDSTEAELRPEMTARAEIVVGARENVLLIPVNAVFEEHGAFVAHVRRLSGIETRPLHLGEASDQVVEVVAGLQDGERVMLSAPLATTGPARPTPPGSPSARLSDGDAPQPR